MKVHGNTLYVQTAGACLHKEGETVKVERETRLTVRIPAEFGVAIRRSAFAGVV